MFMWYAGGRVKHASQPQTCGGDDGDDGDEMDVDEEEDGLPGLEEGRDMENEPQENGALFEELCQVANTAIEGGMTEDWDGMVGGMDFSDHETSNVSVGCEDGGSKDKGSEDEDNVDDLGPEDGEDADHVDTGYRPL
jgi:hypothetical protein